MMDDLQGRLQEAVSDRYTIERKIGRGGMATVFLAVEHHPRRKVAIKVLTPDVATLVLRERFLREVNLVSTLRHPHIVPVFAAGEADGLLYFVMPYIQGESLRQRFVRRGTFPLSKAIAVTRDVASALNYAHGLGVIHRDIKPENILLSDGHALVADFGIARALGVAAGNSLTQAGLALGTPAYMSPEQSEGRRDLDGRTDIYGLACVLLEMLGGTPPGRQTPEQRLDSVRPTTRHMTGSLVTRGGIETVLNKALAVDPSDRYSTANAFREALDDPALVGSAAAPHKRAVGIAVLVGAAAVTVALLVSLLWPSQSGAATPERVVIAVFENQTGDPNLAHLGPMASDWITQGLAQTELLDVVVARGGLTSGPNDGESTAARIRALVQETNAQLVVSGAYYRQGDQLQFQTRLTDPEKDRLLMALNPVVAPVDSPLVAVELLRQRVMGALASLVDPRLTEWATAFSQPPSYDAYQQYVEGMTQFMRLNQPRAIQHFLRAAELDSTFASAMVFAAFAYGTMEQWAQADSLAQIVNRSRNDLTAFDRYELDWVLAMSHGDLDGALTAIRAAGEIAGSETFLLLGLTALWANRPMEALEAFQRVDPQRGFAREFFHYWDLLCSALHSLGRHEEELQEARRGRSLFPELRSSLQTELRALIALGEEEPLDSLWDLLETLPPQFGPFNAVGDIMRLGILEARWHGHDRTAETTLGRALNWYRTLDSDEAASEINRYGLARTLYVAGEYEEARTMFQHLVGEQPDSVGYRGYLGALAARTGDRDEALRISEAISSMTRPFLNGVTTFWRGRIAAALGDAETAVAYLRQSEFEGRQFTGEEKIMVDLQDLRDYQPFLDWLLPKDGRRSQ